jgi:hypothetical protein
MWNERNENNNIKNKIKKKKFISSEQENVYLWHFELFVINVKIFFHFSVHYSIFCSVNLKNINIRSLSRYKIEGRGKLVIQEVTHKHHNIMHSRWKFIKDMLKEWKPSKMILFICHHDHH